MHTEDPPPAPVRRTSFSSKDPEEITDFFRQAYLGNRSWFTAVRDRDASLDAVAAAVSGLAASQVRTSIDYRSAADPAESYIFFTVRHGAARVRRRRTETHLPAGQASVTPSNAPFDFQGTGGFSTQLLDLPREVLDQLAQEVADVPPGERRFEGVGTVSPAMNAYWRSLSALVTGALLDEASPLGSPLLAAATIRTAALAALHVFPNTTLGRQHRPGPAPAAPAAPATLRRAVDHIEADAHEPVQLGDVAAAAGTSARALQLGFRHHLQTTPMGHLRRVRLERAHRELQAADPTRGAAVAAVAARWGFAGSGRFSTAYREAFGVLPSQTLRS